MPQANDPKGIAQEGVNLLHTVTRALRHRIPQDGVQAAVTPLYQNSAFSAESPFFYTRKANPNCVEWEQCIALLESAAFGISTTTGMSAITLALSLVPVGGTLVVHRHLYGCSLKFFHRLAERGLFQLEVLDLTRSDVPWPGRVDMVLFETPTNPFLYTVNISDLSQSLKSKHPQALVVVDNTWATPLFQKPLLLGADLSLHSATKFLSGHSDVMGGILLTQSPELDDRLRQERFFSGCILDPHSAWLLRRSLQTLPLRMAEHQKVTKDFSDFLRQQPQVGEVFLPLVDGKQLTGYGGILFFSLAPAYSSQYLKFRNDLELFGTGTGMACVTSMVAQPYSGSHASLSEDEKKEMDLNEDLIRLCFGLEELEDLKRDVLRALSSLEYSP